MSERTEVQIYEDGITLMTLPAGEGVVISQRTLQLVPTDFYVLPAGSTSDMPSLVVKFKTALPVGFDIVAQISFEMLKPVIAALESAEAAQIKKKKRKQ